MVGTSRQLDRCPIAGSDEGEDKAKGVLAAAMYSSVITSGERLRSTSVVL